MSYTETELKELIDDINYEGFIIDYSHTNQMLLNKSIEKSKNSLILFKN